MNLTILIVVDLLKTVCNVATVLIHLLLKRAVL